MKKKIVFFYLCLSITSHCFAADKFKLIEPNKSTYLYYAGQDQVIETAISMFMQDVTLITDGRIKRNTQLQSGSIVAGVIGTDMILDSLISNYNIDISEVKGEWEAFQLQVVQNQEASYLLVIGSDTRGAAYGVLELSRLLGVSPWVWWADVRPNKKSNFQLPHDYKNVQKPSIQYRGIFLNDEDWGLMPWSSMTYEPSDRKGQIGPKTYSRIFELLLRLRANTLWPAMHEVSIPFYFTEGNKKAAAKYGIILGTSHCEPLMRNSANEWDISGSGDYNYVTNKNQMLSYWGERLDELQGAENIFTIGLRGKHDGMMQGVKNQQEHKAVLSRVIPDQRDLLKKHIHSDISKIPQVFIPYKEVLDVYNDGLDVPDDITMVWCDDNYGYIKHFPNETERARSGGNGIYYHVSYWGRPHDYLWLSTINPSLLHQQMSLAYTKGVQKLWILNVGDIKPAEYQTELFLDMAWNIDAVNTLGVSQHLKQWLGTNFSTDMAEKLTAIKQEYYRLSYIRKPEHMGNTRVEEQDPKYKIIQDLPWSEEEIRQRIHAYKMISDQTEAVAQTIPAHLHSAFFQLVQYPVQASAQMNHKLLHAQLARHGLGSWNDSHTSHDSIISLTAHYNQLENGKWYRIMDSKPRNLSVFHRVPEEKSDRDMITYKAPAAKLQAQDAIGNTKGTKLIKGMGHSNAVLSVDKGATAHFAFDHEQTDTVHLEIRLVPNHAVDGKNLRFTISLNEDNAQEVSYKTEGRSEEWKQNVLRNQAIRRLAIPIKSGNKSALALTALDEGVLLDEIIIF